MPAWYDNDAFWHDMEAVLFTAERWKTAEKEAAAVATLTGAKAGDALLDLGCGPGRHALNFAKLGYRVTGVDRTAAFIDGARRRAADATLDIEWVRADMREFRRPAAFDLAVSMLTSFGYFDDLADDRRVLCNVLASLRPGGGLVIDIMSKEVLARIYRPRDWHEGPDGTLLLEERHVDDAWSWLNMRWVVIGSQARREHRFRLRLYAASELAALLRDVGFADATAYGSLEKAPYDNNAERLVVLARKPA
jgi:SAM-dependent methyltransferase